MLGVGLGIGKRGYRGFISGGPAEGNLIANEPWIEGADTQLLHTSDRAYARAEILADPWIYKQIQGLIVGHTYRVTGTAYPEVVGEAVTLRVATDTALSAGLLVDEAYTVQSSIDEIFVATVETMYVGIIVGVTAIGQKGGVSWNLQVIDEAFTTNEVFIDSVAGDDLDDGSEANPWQTFSRLPSITDDMIINLKRGSLFREQLDFTIRNNVTVRAYSTGVLPSIDASDITPNSGWTAQPGPNTNVYLKTLTFENESAGELAGIWEDGVRPIWVADIATCQATPGSWTGDIYTLGTTTYDYYIHPFGSTNPNTDGKEYTYTARQRGIKTGTRCHIHNIRTRKQRGNTGSLHLGRYSVAIGCIAEDGPYNNAKGESFTRFEDCIFYKSDYCNRENWLGLRFHESTVLPGATATAIRCITMTSEEVRDLTIGTPWTQTGIMTYIDSGDFWATATYEDCASKWNRIGFRMTAVNNGTISESHVAETANAIIIDSANTNITDFWIEDTTEPVEGFQGGIALQDGNINVDGFRAALDGCALGFIYNESLSSGTINISNSVFYELPGSVSMLPLIRSPGDKVVTINNTIINPDTTTGTSIVEAKMTPDVWPNNIVTGADNSFWRIHEIDNLTFADFKTGEPLLTTSMNFNAVEQLTDPANGDFTWAAPDNDAALGNIGVLRFPTYIEIPTEAEVDAM